MPTLRPAPIPFNVVAATDSLSCAYLREGCTNNAALNFHSWAEVDDGSCAEVVTGCTDSSYGGYDASATTLALSNVAIQALTTILGIYFFHTAVTTFLVAGVGLTLATTAVYTCIKTFNLLERRDAKGDLI